MNMNPIVIDVFIIVVLGILAFLTLTPIVMPMGLFLTSLLALIVLFGAFAAYVWREAGGDEREEQLLFRSDRIAFLAGSSVLMLAIVIEGIMQHMTNPWVLGAFSAMIIAKAAAYIYNQYTH